MPPLLGDLMNGAAINVGSCGIEARREGAAYGFDISGARGCEHPRVVVAVGRDVVDMRLQGAPAPEAMVEGDGQLGLVEPGSRVACAQLREPLLGGLLEPVDVGSGREGLRHGTPSFFAPGDRSSRARKKEMSARYGRRVQPFTRSVGRLLDRCQPTSGARGASIRCSNRAPADLQ